MNSLTKRGMALFFLLAAVTGNAVAQSSPAPGSIPERTLSADQFREGVRLVHTKMIERAPRPYRAFSRAEIEAEVARLAARTAPASEAEVFIALSRLIGMMRDGHSWISLDDSTQLFSRSVPLRFWHFSDGIHVRAAAPQYAALVGARVAAINGEPIVSAWEKILDGVGGGGQIAAGRAVVYAGMPEFLRALGIGQNDDAIQFTLELANGREEILAVPARRYSTYSEAFYAANGWTTPEGWIEPDGADRAPWFARREEAFWYEFRPETRTVYAQFNVATTDPEHPWDPVNDSFRPMLREMFERVKGNDVDRLVIDLRNNHGGNSALWQPLVHGIIRTEKLYEPGRLFVIIGRLTESAAVAWATRIEANSRAVFVGEPTATPPNFANDPAGPRRERYNVPGSAINFRVANSMEQWSVDTDERAAIHPDVPVALSWDDFAAGRDPVMEAILRIGPERADAFFVESDGDPIRPTALWANYRRRSQATASRNWR